MACLWFVWVFLDYGFSERKEKVEGVSGVVNLPSKAKRKHRKASVSHAAPREPAGEVSEDLEIR